MQRITLSRSANNKSEAKVIGIDELLPQSDNPALQYNSISPSLLAEIQSMESIGQFGSKIQTLVKHLLWMKENEPGAKSIVFSAWSDSLDLVAWALENNGVTFLKIDASNRKFSPAREFQVNDKHQVLLLHG